MFGAAALQVGHLCIHASRDRAKRDRHKFHCQPSIPLTPLLKSALLRQLGLSSAVWRSVASRPFVGAKGKAKAEDHDSQTTPFARTTKEPEARNTKKSKATKVSKPGTRRV